MKPKTQEQLDRITSQRLEKKFGRDLKWYNKQLEEQGGGCRLCGSTEKTRRLHVDHDHKVTQVKIDTQRLLSGKWQASATYRGREYVGFSEKRNLAIQDIRSYLKRDSVRGLLCFKCNKFVVGDNTPEILRKAADYIEAHQGVKNETDNTN